MKITLLVVGKTTDTHIDSLIQGRQNDVKIKLTSKKYRVATSAEFMNFLVRNEFNYFINI